MADRSILLISPPVSKPCEPPAGLAKLAWALRAQKVDCRIYDAGIDGILDLLHRPIAADDTWSRRALAGRTANIDALRSLDLYRNRDRYKRAVMDVNRILHMAGLEFGAALSLSNFGSSALSPVRSADLIRAAEVFESNPFYSIFSKKLLDLFDQREPAIVGMSINFMSQALCAFSMIGFIRRHLPQTRIICGGGLVTSWMNIPNLGNPFGGLIDEMVCGPGENRLIALCTGKDEIQPTVTGYDFSSLNMDRYLSPVRVLPYATSRGCYWKKCAFCPETAEDAPYSTETPQALLEDLRQAAAHQSTGLVHFLDNALSPRLLGYLIKHPPGLPWYGFARVTRHLTDPDFARGLKASGCVMLKLGVESGDQDVLDALGKGIDIGTVSKALDTIHQAGIATYVYLLFGTPAEDERSAAKTLEFTLAHAPSIDFLNLAIFNLPAYSQEAGGLDTVDFYEGDLSLYREFVHPQGWSRDRVRRFLSTAFKRPAAIRAILNNDPPFFTSNHAPFSIW
ncbi:B12-binding domain-containing radical SAM protein [Desulfosarcina sp.]|uniref:B12-binding domain-containing radical SAM protein n=1 Tax=Desulfosarcina sp. TaxID=2027861 RepID=UPI0029B8C6A1|nr:B12-binding domain-containing radical SAM protein [Desulfosarcina sp.]MDX2452615.1 B12-binding domain-containing radical SAM protein [Desulfosarcina sp.]MDX2490392.1 B12-binding domain-containing radical SAM protein [Desulfosarcina sp.]